MGGGKNENTVNARATGEVSITRRFCPRPYTCPNVKGPVSFPLKVSSRETGPSTSCAFTGASWKAFSTYGIEPAEKGAFGRHRGLEAIPAAPTFDLAIAHHVLEHVTDPLGILRALRGCLRPGGMLLVSVPRLDTLPEHGDYYYCINDRVHIMSYTRDAMATLLGMAGFEAIDVEQPGGGGVERWRARKRLRMIGRNTGSRSGTIARPLAAARRAFKARPGSAGRRTRFGGRMSVRAAAAIMNFERERRHEARSRGPSGEAAAAPPGEGEHEADRDAQQARPGAGQAGRRDELEHHGVAPRRHDDSA